MFCYSTLLFYTKIEIGKKNVFTGKDNSEMWYDCRGDNYSKESIQAGLNN